MQHMNSLHILLAKRESLGVVIYRQIIQEQKWSGIELGMSLTLSERRSTSNCLRRRNHENEIRNRNFNYEMETWAGQVEVFELFEFRCRQ